MSRESGINRYTDMISAYVYLQVMTIINIVVQRVKRLKQPRYLIGAIGGLAYFYFFFFSNALRSDHSHTKSQHLDLANVFTTPVLAISALILLVVALLNWLIPRNRAALQFSEAEVAFLFPAPVTRRMLIHFKLLRSQFAILLSSLFMTLVFGQLSILGGNQFLHAIGWWLILSTINLHIIAASFTRERLLDVGINPTRRRIFILFVLILIACGCWWTLFHHLAPPIDADLVNQNTLINYANKVLESAPLSWFLLPFKLVVAPIFANNNQQFLYALGPALLILIAHYFWVIQSDVSFEEASIDLARRRAERITAVRDGNARFTNTPLKPRTVPFRLSAKGFISIAFLWKGLIALGPLYRLRTWLIACAIIILGSLWLMADPNRIGTLNLIGGISIGIGIWLFIAGPMFMTRGLRKTLEHLDILKASPVHGWQIVLGELLPPITLMTFLLWLIILIGGLSFGAHSDNALITVSSTLITAIGTAIIAAPLSGLMLCVPFAGMLFFPAWIDMQGAGNNGIEVIGQRMVFFAGYFVLLFIVLIPVSVLGALALLLGYWLAGIITALILATVVSSLVLGVELYGAVIWLGHRLENFDISLEMPR
jgi:ABC-2 type transport system permease protein